MLFFSSAVQSQPLLDNGTLEPIVQAMFVLLEKKLNNNQALPKALSTEWKEQTGSLSLNLADQIGQALLLRPHHEERLSKASQAYYRQLLGNFDEIERQSLWQFFKELGYFDVRPASQKHFDYILLQGSTVQIMRQRVMFLSDAVAAGAIELNDTTQLFFLEGYRKLFDTENETVLKDSAPYSNDPQWLIPEQLPVNEMQASEWIWQQLHLTPKLRQQPIVFLHAEKKENAVRAQTEDCVKQWLSRYKPRAGVALVVSSNPLIDYQVLVTKKTLHKMNRSDIEVIGAGPVIPQEKRDPQIVLGVLLDTLARMLYMENNY